MQEFKDILLPVETSARELDAKLLLALFAAESGFRCHIGTMTRIQNPGFVNSIYVSKSVRFAKAVRQMSYFGNTVVAWDEEGLARFNDVAHSTRIEPEALQIPRLLFSWGSSNAAMWRNHPFYNGRTIVESGNPRVDLLRPELRSLHQPKCDDIRARYGSFALLNTNFALVNHFKAGGRRAKVASKSQDARAFIEFRQGLEEYKRRLFRAFLAAIPEIARAIEPYHLLIRPHPSEDPKPWQEAGRGISNVDIVYEGSVIPWLLAAKCLIHNGCTSAVEASVLRMPVLAYRPFENATYDIPLPNALSETFATPQSLSARALECIAVDWQANPKPEPAMLLREHVASLDGSFACEKIVTALKGLQGADSMGSAAIIGRLLAHGMHAFRAARRAVSSSRRNYEEHKSRPEEFTLQDITKRAGQMRMALGRFENVGFSQHSPGVVTLSPRPIQR